MSEPTTVVVPVLAGNWRAARRAAMDEIRRHERFRDRDILWTHTEPSVAWGPDFQTWTVEIEFAPPDAVARRREVTG